MLVAIAIPVFTAQLEKSREATDQANLRSAYAEVMADYLMDQNSTKAVTVTQKQQVADWATTPEFDTNSFEVEKPTATKGSWSVSYDKTNNKVKASYNAS